MSGLVLLLVVLAGAHALQSPAVEGVVIRGGTNEPVARARVLVSSVDEANEPASLRRTDDTGRFVVPGLRAGRYRLAVDRDGYVRAVSIIEVKAAAPTTTTVVLMPTGVITGRVVDANSTPSVRAIVRAVAGSKTYDTVTNDLGEYRLFDLPAGRYVVNAAPYPAPRIEGATLIRPTPPGPYAPGEGMALLSLPQMLKAGEYIDPMALTREVYVPVYYPGTTDAAAAAALDLAPGATLSAIDVTVARAPAR